MVSSYHEHGESTLALYDLSDPGAWERAGRELEAWGKSRSAVHTLDPDHIVIEYLAGGAVDIQEPA